MPQKFNPEVEPQTREALARQEMGTRMFIVTSFIIAENWEQLESHLSE